MLDALQNSVRSAPPVSGRTRVYRADSRFEIGVAGAVRAVVGEIRDFRSHIVTLFRQDFCNSYRGTRLGVFWNFALPLAPIGVYALLAGVRVLPRFEGLSPIVYIGLGITLWFLLAGCIQKPISVVRSSNSEVMKTALPLSAVIASSFARLIFDTLVRLGLVVAAAVVTLAVPSPFAPLAILVIGIAILFALGLGLLLSILNVVYPDIERVVTIGLQYGLFVSGVIFPLSSLGPLKVLSYLNPFSVLIGSVRDLIFHGTLEHPLALGLVSFTAVVVFLVSVRLFYVMEYRIRGLI